MSKVALTGDAQKALIKGSFGKDGLLLPFVQEIFLLECHVAGTMFRKLADIESSLAAGNILTFKREPDNTHDKLAIEIFDQEDRSLGYVPRKNNEILARLMDAGKLIFGKIESVEKIDQWMKIEVRIYMRDF